MVTMISKRYGGRLSLSVAEAAEVSGVKRSTAYHLIQQGRFPHHRAGRATHVFIPALLAWIASGGAPNDHKPSPRRPARPVRPGGSAGAAGTFAAWSSGVEIG
jgi:excisionase family DNA binding protein